MDIAPSDDSTAEAKTYINKILEKAAAYRRTDAVWSQHELKNSLNRVVNEGRGEFCCILGGVNTGKSLVLAELMSKNSNQSVALVDMRDGSTILRGLICSLRRDYGAVFDAALSEVVKSLPSRFSVTDSLVRLGVSLDPDAVLAYFLYTDYFSDASKLCMLLSEVAKLSPKNAAGCGLTVIIDQANIAFTDRWGKDARDTLSTFVGLTKQRHEVSFILNIHVYTPRIHHTMHVLAIRLT